MLKFRWFSRSTFPAKEAAAQLLKKHLLFKNTCQIIVFKIRVITKIVCSFLFSKKIEEGSYFELFVKFPFFFKIGIFPPKTLQPYKSFGKHCSQQNDCRNACCQNSVNFFILKIGDRELHFYYTDNKFTILRNGILLFFRFFAENGSFWK